MNDPLFYGCATALVTPFRGDDVDFDALGRLIDRQIGAGIDALVVLGTTGEPASLRPGERSAVIDFSIRRCEGRLPVIVGAGSNDTRTAVSLAKQAGDAGADGVLVVTPYYNKTSQEGLIRHFTQVADAVDIPVILYNVPGRTGLNLEPRTVASLARHPNIRGVKEASGSPRQLTDLQAACGDRVALYCGSDDQTVPAMALGARGVISVAANVVPGQMKALTSLWLAGDAKGALSLQNRLLPLMRALFMDVNPIPVKAALSMMGLIENTLRLPLVPLSGENEAHLRQVLKQAKLL